MGLIHLKAFSKFTFGYKYGIVHFRIVVKTPIICNFLIERKALPH